MDISNNENNTSTYYAYDDYFKDYLKRNKIEGKEFEGYEIEKRKTMMLKIQKEYRKEYPEDYKIELKKREELYEKEKKKKEEEMKEAKEEYERIKKEEIIQLVLRQTTYNYEEVKERLEDNKYNYLELLREYMEISKKEEKKDKSVNQEIYSQLRSFMDYGTRKYYKNKRIQEDRNRDS
jgi:NACalpha-BTF3-like transcription factor